MKTLLAILLMSSGAVAQSWAQHVEDFFTRVHAHIAKVQEQQAFDKRAKHVGTRERAAKATIKRVDRRYLKVEKRIKGWLHEIEGRRGLDRRLRDLQSKSTAVRGSTMRHRYGSIIADVKRKIAQRESWIKKADQERLDLNETRIQALEILEESAKIRERMARQVVTQG